MTERCILPFSGRDAESLSALVCQASRLPVTFGAPLASLLLSPPSLLPHLPFHPSPQPSFLPRRPRLRSLRHFSCLPPTIIMAARHHHRSRSQEGYPAPSPPADMNEPFNSRQYYDNDVEQSETYHRDNYGSESSAAGLNDYDHPDPYSSSSFPLSMICYHSTSPFIF